MIAALIIALREGLEIALVVVIMLAYLRKSNQSAMNVYVFSGLALAGITSLLIGGGIVAIWGSVEEVVLEIFEGVLVIIASLLLTTMIVWMKRKGKEISSDIKASIEGKLQTEGRWGLTLLSFALVLREGVEIVLFTAALVIREGYQTYIGLTLGLVLAAGVGIGIYRGSLEIRFRTFFKWTSAFLILFAAGMLAYGIHELQEAGFLLIGPLEIWNINPSTLPGGAVHPLHEDGFVGGLAKSLFGYNGNPSALEVASYLSYLLVMGIYFFKEREKNSVPSVSKDLKDETPSKRL
jgi:high-affinity iron transporter